MHWPLRVLAVDPGPLQSAVVAIGVASQAGDISIELKAICPNDRVRATLLAESPSSIVAIEMIASYGMPVGREVFATCVEIGRMIEARSGREGSAPVLLIPRLEVKLAVCRSPRANDASVRAALLDRIGPRGTKREPGPTYGVRADMWAALGVAVAALERAMPLAALPGGRLVKFSYPGPAGDPAEPGRRAG